MTFLSSFFIFLFHFKTAQLFDITIYPSKPALQAAANQRAKRAGPVLVHWTGPVLSGVPVDLFRGISQ